MRRKAYHHYALILIVALLTACSTTKYVPEGEYLLNSVNIEMKDKGVSSSELNSYVQQQPNGFKAGVSIYNMVPNDSTWVNRMIRKLGEPAVIYKPHLVDITVDELTAEMNNLGYLNAAVSADVKTEEPKKAEVTYTVEGGEPYRIRDYTVDLTTLKAGRSVGRARRGSMQSRTSRTIIKRGTIFAMPTLEQEMKRITTELRDQGYYAFTESSLHYLADTTLMSNEVDLRLILRDTASAVPYTIQRVNVYSGFDPLERDKYKIVDSTEYKGIHIYYDSLKFLRRSVISRKVQVEPGRLYRDRSNDATFNQFRTLPPVGRVNVEYVENNYADSTLLDCNIYLTPGNIHSTQVGLEGTNKAGDLGVAMNVTYGHQNIFNGGEIFNLSMRAAYEFVGGDDSEALNHNYYELGISPSLTFPNISLPYLNTYMDSRFNSETQYSLGYSIQQRPEYMRNFFNFNWRLNWRSLKQNLSHSLSILDINYVNMPWMSEQFKDYLNNEVDPLTRYSYDNVFTAGLRYGLVWSKGVRRNNYTLRFNAETSGNALKVLFDATNATRSETNQYNIFGNAFAQYVKADLELTDTYRIDHRNSFAFRLSGGVALPYGNSTVLTNEGEVAILPFEKRYYAGGPNSVRGWSTRHLGPGANRDTSGNPAIHVGDINLIASAEYRFKPISWLEPAFFVDAGNIWTIKEYASQPDGRFRWDTFYKQIAVGTGIGLRFDLSFLIVRVDAGTKVYDPAEGMILFKKPFFRNSAMYFAIGYPF